MAAAAALFTSCSKDDTIGGLSRGKVTFEVSAPELATRAQGDGTTATTLQYAVYDMVENTMVKTEKLSNKFTSGTASLSIDLVEGRTYEVAFWAESPSSPYAFDAGAKTISYTSTASLTANNENYDAFFAYVGDDQDEKFEVGQTVNVTLKRPFAQLNIATNDTETAKDLGVEVVKTAVKVKAFTSFNLQTGAVVGDKTDVEFGLATKMSGKLATPSATTENTYDWLSMNYILTDGTNTDVTFTFTDAVGSTEEEYTRTYTSVPAKRNYRTNIIGSILTDPTVFELDIEEGFTTPDEEHVVGDVRKVSSAEDIIDAFETLADNDPDNDVNEVVLEDDIYLNDYNPSTENTSTQLTTRAGEKAYGLLIPAGKELTIDLAGFTISQEKTCSASYSMIENKGSLTIIDSSSNKAGKISFKDTSAGDSNAGWGSYTIRNEGTLVVEDGTIEHLGEQNVDGKAFAHTTLAIYQYSGSTTINGGTISAPQYRSVRLWKGDMTINGGTFKGQVWVQAVDNTAKMTINGGTFAPEWNDKSSVFVNNIDAQNNHYDVTFSVTGGTFTTKIGMSKPIAAISGGTFHDASAFNFLADNAEITLGADVTLDTKPYTNAPIGSETAELIKINGDGHTITFNQLDSNWANVYSSGKLVLNDVNIAKSGYGVDGGEWNTHVIMFNCEVEMNDVTSNHALGVEKNATLKDVSITEDEGFYGLWITADGQTVDVDGLKITATNDGRGIKIVDQYTDSPASVTLNVKNSSFETAEKAAVLVTSTAGAEINWGENNDISKVAADKVFAVWVDEERANYADKVTVNGANVKVEGENAYVVANAEDLAALNTKMSEKSAGKNVVVYLVDDIDFTGKTWTPVDSHADTKFTFAKLDGKGHTISNLTINGQAMFTRFAGNQELVTIKDVTFDNATVASDKLNTSILTVQSYENVLLDNVDVKNSSITGGFKVAPLIATVYNEGSSTVTATLKNCDVENVTVKATSYDFCTAGMVAFVNAGDNDKIVFENCTVKDVKLIAPDDSYDAHAAIYTEGAGTLYNEAEGVTVSNVTFEVLSK